MDGFNSHIAGGSLQISSDVIEKIAKQACMEVEGVRAVNLPRTGAKSILGKMMAANPIVVNIKEDVAEIDVALVVEYGAKIPELSERVQQSVKNSVQSMTSITVAQVNILITGISADE